MHSFRIWSTGVNYIVCGVQLTTATPTQNMFLDQVSYVPDQGADAPPMILSQPQAQSGRLGFSATFRVLLLSHSPLSYRWHKDGLTLADDGRLVGTTTAALTVNNLQMSDLGNYSVVASNNLGVTNSADAALSLAPSILAHDPSLGFRSGRFGFNIYGTIGSIAIVEASADLTHWIALSTNTLLTNPFYYSDPGGTPSQLRRWYRVR